MTKFLRGTLLIFIFYFASLSSLYEDVTERQFYESFCDNTNKPVGQPNPCSELWFNRIKAREIGELKNMLIHNNIEINQVNKQKNNTLHIVAQLGSEYYWIASFLINNGIDINATNAKKETPLLTAIKSKNQEVAKLIIKRGLAKDENKLNLYVKDSAGFSILHNIVLEDNIVLMEEIIATKAACNINPVDANGQTPLHLARSNQMILLLLQMGAEANKKDRWDIKAIDSAQQNVERIKAQTADQEQKEQRKASTAPRLPRRVLPGKTIPDILRPSNFGYFD